MSPTLPAGPLCRFAARQFPWRAHPLHLHRRTSKPSIQRERHQVPSAARQDYQDVSCRCAHHHRLLRPFGSEARQPLSGCHRCLTSTHCRRTQQPPCPGHAVPRCQIAIQRLHRLPSSGNQQALPAGHQSELKAPRSLCSAPTHSPLFH